MRNYSPAVTKTICPFYIRDTKSEIYCEGIQEDTETVMRFRSKHKKQEYQERHCYLVDTHCKYCKLLYQNYRI